MKQEYIYSNGNVIAYDDKKGFCEGVEYQDNIEEIFETENMIEEIKEEIPLLKKEKEIIERTKTKSKKNILTPLISSIIISLTFPTLALFLISLMSNVSFYNIIYTYNGINLAKFTTIFILPLLTFMGTLSTLENWNRYNEKIKNINGLNNKIGLLEKELIIKETKLNELKENKTKENEMAMKKNIKNRINLSNLYELKELLELYYNIGYYEKKLMKHYNKGNLSKKISKKYNEEKRTIIEEHIKSKVKSLKKEK